MRRPVACKVATANLGVSWSGPLQAETLKFKHKMRGHKIAQGHGCHLQSTSNEDPRRACSTRLSAAI
jgi:hypothetical protein